MEIGYVILYVGELERSVAFYRDVVGLAYKFTDAGYAEFDAEGVRFALYERRRAGWVTGRGVLPGARGGRGWSGLGGRGMKRGREEKVGLLVDRWDASAERRLAGGVDLRSGLRPA